MFSLTKKLIISSLAGAVMALSFLLVHLVLLLVTQVNSGESRGLGI